MRSVLRQAPVSSQGEDEGDGVNDVPECCASSNDVHELLTATLGRSVDELRRLHDDDLYYQTMKRTLCEWLP